MFFMTCQCERSMNFLTELGSAMGCVALRLVDLVLGWVGFVWIKLDLIKGWIKQTWIWITLHCD